MKKTGRGGAVREDAARANPSGVTFCPASWKEGRHLHVVDWSTEQTCSKTDALPRGAQKTACLLLPCHMPRTPLASGRAHGCTLRPRHKGAAGVQTPPRFVRRALSPVSGAWHVLHTTPCTRRCCAPSSLPHTAAPLAGRARTRAMHPRASGPCASPLAVRAAYAARDQCHTTLRMIDKSSACHCLRTLL